MPQFVVYAPVSGYITGLDSYCSGGTHPKVRSSDCCPTDISANANAEVRLYASSSVKSVGLEFISYVCAVDPSPWTDGIIAHMYDLNGFEIGSVVYGHLTNRGIDGHYNGQVITYNGGYIRVGQVPGLCTDCHHCSKCSTNWELCASCPYWSGGSGDPKSCKTQQCAYCTNCPNCCTTCYTGPHSHLECNTGSRGAMSCSPATYMYQGTSTLFVIPY